MAGLMSLLRRIYRYDPCGGTQASFRTRTVGGGRNGATSPVPGLGVEVLETFSIKACWCFFPPVGRRNKNGIGRPYIKGVANQPKKKRPRGGDRGAAEGREISCSQNRRSEGSSAGGLASRFSKSFLRGLVTIFSRLPSICLRLLGPGHVGL